MLGVMVKKNAYCIIEKAIRKYEAEKGSTSELNNSHYAVHPLQRNGSINLSYSEVRFKQTDASCRPRS